MLPDQRAAIELAMTRAIADFLDHRERYESGRDDDSDARMELGALLDAVAWSAGEPVLKGAFGVARDDVSRAEALKLVARRASLVSAFTRTTEDAASFSEVAAEVEAIAAGDTPALFARVGQKKVKYREYREKLRALCWDRILEGAGLSTRDRRHAIEGAYNTSWNTISKWDHETRSALGDSLVDRELNRASRLIKGPRGLSATWRVQMAMDANRLKAAARRSRSAGADGIEI